MIKHNELIKDDIFWQELLENLYTTKDPTEAFKLMDLIVEYKNELINILQVERKNELTKKVCPNCGNPYPHLYEGGGGHCEECNTSWTN